MRQLFKFEHICLNVLNRYLAPKHYKNYGCSYPMDKFNVEVEGIKYLVQANGDGSFSLLSKGVEVLKLRLIVGASLAFKWESDEGYKNQLIDKIGQAIEDHSL